MYQKKEILSTPNAPAALGPYSQGVLGAGFVFTAMQLPLDPTSGEVVSGGVEAQTRQLLENLKAIVEAAGSSLDCAVKVTLYLVDLGDFDAINGVYEGYFLADPPARAIVTVTALPRGAQVAGDLIALGRDSSCHGHRSEEGL